ncbi:MAG: hypothetical protein M3R65_06920 [Gemmatimonadota bacterium]|nr:hypothetical protein [Gemmatimonadota bacterium]
MTDVLVQFDEPQLSADGRLFVAQVVVARLPTGLWEAWIEFQPQLGGDTMRSCRETEQLSRGDLRFWAAGITRQHLAACLKRALDSHNADNVAVVAPTTAANTTGAAGAAERMILDTSALNTEAPLLDPVAVYRQSGEYTLRQELRALDARQLADIIAGHSIEDMDVVDLARTYEDALAEQIVASVQHTVERAPKYPLAVESVTPK